MREVSQGLQHMHGVQAQPWLLNTVVWLLLLVDLPLFPWHVLRDLL